MPWVSLSSQELAVVRRESSNAIQKQMQDRVSGRKDETIEGRSIQKLAYTADTQPHARHRV